MKKIVENIKGKKNVFITRLKILKQLKENGNTLTVDTIKDVFNINTNKKKNVKNENIDFFFQDTKDTTKKENNKKSKIKLNNNSKKEDKTIKEKRNKKTTSTREKAISFFIILTIIIFNIFISLGFFDFANNTKFNTVNEQFTEIISRSIKSPQTDVYLKSKYDEDEQAIVYYYEIIDKLDFYTYKIKNTDVNHELRNQLLENIAKKSKVINNINSIKTTDLNTITFVGDSYIINNKYKINEKNIDGKDINMIVDSIKNNNIREYETLKIEFSLYSFISISILEFSILFFIKKSKRKDA